MSSSESASNIRELSPELQKRARKELNEDPATRAQSIQIIRDWIKQQPHLNAQMDDAFILRFLRYCHFSLERTKERIDKFYTVRTAIPEWYTKRDIFDPKLQELLDSGFFVVLPGYDKQGCKVIIIRIAKWNPNRIHINLMEKLDKILGDYVIEDEVGQVCGCRILFDIADITMGHISSFTPSIAKKFVTIWQDCMPVIPKSIDIFNDPAIFQTLLSMFKVFLAEDLKKMLIAHGKNLKPVFKEIPPEILPTEYNGKAGPIKDLTENLKKELAKRREQFLEDEKYGVDEFKRPGKPHTQEDLFGVDGSFRKLNID